MILRLLESCSSRRLYFWGLRCDLPCPILGALCQGIPLARVIIYGFVPLNGGTSYQFRIFFSRSLTGMTLKLRRSLELAYRYRQPLESQLFAGLARPIGKRHS